MKANSLIQTSLGQTCLATCQKIVVQRSRVKTALYAEWRAALTTQERLLQLALNEAEAQAWQTEFPHLVFPVLATEKAQAVAAWNRRQQLLRSPQHNH